MLVFMSRFIRKECVVSLRKYYGSNQNENSFNVQYIIKIHGIDQCALSLPKISPDRIYQIRSDCKNWSQATQNSNSGTSFTDSIRGSCQSDRARLGHSFFVLEISECVSLSCSKHFLVHSDRKPDCLSSCAAEPRIESSRYEFRVYMFWRKCNHQDRKLSTIISNNVHLSSRNIFRVKVNMNYFWSGGKLANLNSE